MFLELVVLLCVVLWIHFKWKRRHLQKLSKQLKSNLMSLPIIGHSYLLAGSDEQRMRDFQKIGMDAIDSGGTSAIWHGFRIFVVVADPKVADIVMKSCLEKHDIQNVFQKVTGDGSVFTSVEKWRPRRKLLAPTFNKKNLNRFVEVFAEQSRIMADKLKNLTGKGPCSLWDILSSYSMDAVCGTTLGTNVNAQNNSNHPFVVAIERVFQSVAILVCRPWLQIELILKRLPLYSTMIQDRTLVYNFIDEIIRNKCEEKENGRQNPETPSCFLELMLDSPDKVDKMLIREECLVFLGAGTDTSSVGMGYIVLMLARYPEVQQKVYQELLEVFGESDRPVQAADIPRFKYLDAVIRETLRLYPPAPVLSRKVTKDVLLPSGVNLVTGCGIVIHVWALHRNPMYWGADAEQFRPERFLELALDHPAAFMPFSYGPRNCLGYQYAMMSMKTVLATLVRRYRFSGASPLRLKYDIMMRHIHNYTVSIEPRKLSDTPPYKD